MARRAAVTCFFVLTVFALAGSLIFRFFGITLPAFEIAGGLILLLIYRPHGFMREYRLQVALK